MTFELFDYQNTGADFLAGRRRALLLDAPGLGKTAQAISAADRIGATSMDTVCPASVVNQWRKAHADISLTDGIFRSHSYESAREKGISRKPTVLCLDEIHYLKNPSSRRTARILGTERYGRDGLIFKADYVWGMTGTLMPKDPGDLYQIMFAIIPGSLALKNGNTLDYWQFMRRFCIMRDTGHGMATVATRNLDELRERLAPYILRRTKKEARKDWKEPVTAELWLDPGEAADMMTQAELEPEARIVADVFKKEGFKGLQRLTDTEKNGVSRYRRYIGMLKVLPVVKWLLSQFDDGLEKIVVMAVHREVIEAIQQKLGEQDIESVIFYGGMTEMQKELAKTDFINRPEVIAIIGQIDTIGTGTDGLQATTGRMLFVEWSWIHSTNSQALDRLDRVGQEEPVLGQFAAFEGSLDGAIMTVAARRAKDSETLFG